MEPPHLPTTPYVWQKKANTKSITMTKNILLSMLAVAAAVGAARGQEFNQTEFNQTIYDILMEGNVEGKYSLAVSAMNLTIPNILDLLKQTDSDWTIFLPLDADYLEAITTEERAVFSEDAWSGHRQAWIEHHLVPGIYYLEDLATLAEPLQSLQSSFVSFGLDNSTQSYFVADPQDEQRPVTFLSTTDIQASNGVIHEIQGVLRHRMTQESIYTLGSTSSDFTTFVNLTALAGVTNLAQDDGPRTVLAPTNEAFESLAASCEINLEDIELLRSIFQYHVAEENIYANNVAPGMKITTVQGEDVIVTADGVSDGVNEVNVVNANVLLRNGVVHAIDGVMIPPSLRDNCIQSTGAPSSGSSSQSTGDTGSSSQSTGTPSSGSSSQRSAAQWNLYFATALLFVIGLPL